MKEGGWSIPDLVARAMTLVGDWEYVYWKDQWCITMWSGQFLIEHQCPQNPAETVPYASSKYANITELISSKDSLRCGKCADSCSLGLFEKWIFLRGMDA